MTEQIKLSDYYIKKTNSTNILLANGTNTQQTNFLKTVGDGLTKNNSEVSVDFGATNTKVARGDHTHTGVYQPVGNYLTATTASNTYQEKGDYAAATHLHDDWSDKTTDHFRNTDASNGKKKYSFYLRLYLNPYVKLCFADVTGMIYFKGDSVDLQDNSRNYYADFVTSNKSIETIREIAFPLHSTGKIVGQIYTADDGINLRINSNQLSSDASTIESNGATLNGSVVFPYRPFDSLASDE